MKKEVFALVVIILSLATAAAVEVKESYNINEELIPDKIVIPESAEYFAIKYIPTITYNLEKVELFTVGFTNATLQIRDNDNNKPDEIKAEIDFFIGGPYEEWKGQSFPQPITVEKDKIYWVVITSPLMIVPQAVQGTQFTYLKSNDGISWENESSAPFMLIFNGEGDQAPTPGGGGSPGGGGGSGGNNGGSSGNLSNNESNTGGSEEPPIDNEIIADLNKITDEIKKRPVLLLSIIFGILGLAGIVVIFFIIRVKKEHKNLLNMSQQELSQKMHEEVPKDTNQQEQQIQQPIQTKESQSNYAQQQISQTPINKDEMTKSEIKQLVQRGYEYLRINQKTYAEDTYRQIQEKYSTLSSIDQPLYSDIIQFYTYITNTV